MSVWIVQTGEYDEEKIIGVAESFDKALRIALDHSRSHPVSVQDRASLYELEEWEMSAKAPSAWEDVFARNGELIEGVIHRTDVSQLIDGPH